MPLRLPTYHDRRVITAPPTYVYTGQGRQSLFAFIRYVKLMLTLSSPSYIITHPHATPGLQKPAATRYIDARMYAPCTKRCPPRPAVTPTAGAMFILLFICRTGMPPCHASFSAASHAITAIDIVGHCHCRHYHYELTGHFQKISVSTCHAMPCLLISMSYMRQRAHFNYISAIH